MTIRDRLIHRADDLNHYTNPRKGQCWSKTLCLYDSELLCWESGDVKTRPTWGGSRQLARKAEAMLRELTRDHHHRQARASWKEHKRLRRMTGWTWW